MSLDSLITEFQVKSGRFELSTEECLAVLNSASKLLDNLDTSSRKFTRFYQILNADEFIVTLPSEARVIESVSCIVGTQFTPLVYMAPLELRELLRESTSSSTPEYYTLLNARIADVPEGAELDFPMDLDVLTLDPAANQRYVLLYPKLSVQTAVEVTGIFYSPSLSVTNPANRWSASRSDLLIQAAMYYLTKDLLNIDESTKQLKDLQYEMSHIIYDSYQEECINQMGG